MNILITGGAGFIGSHLVEQLLKKNHKISVIDNLSTGRIQNLKGLKNRIKFYNFDLSKKGKWQDILKNIDVVFHLAALADIVPSIQNPDKYFRANVIATKNLVECCIKNKVKKIIYSASSSCYGIPKKYPTFENETIDPKYPYALTKRMAEELTKYMSRIDIRCRYIHSDVDTLERVEIMQDLRLGIFDVLVGVNLLREGLDLPEVSLVAILDADKEGFLRSARSLTQTVGRAARNLNGKAILYADKITKSMQATMDATDYRREKQIAYNTKHNITPTAIKKSLENALTKSKKEAYTFDHFDNLAAESKNEYLTKPQLEKKIRATRKAMEKAAKELDFMAAAKMRDAIKRFQKELEVLKK